LTDKLYKELEYYKQGSADKYVDQVMKAIIKVRKDMAKQIRAEEFSTCSVEELRKEDQYVDEIDADPKGKTKDESSPLIVNLFQEAMVTKLRDCMGHYEAAIQSNGICQKYPALREG